MIALAAAAFALAYAGLVIYAVGRRVSPDGRRYLAMAVGEPAPIPFHYRWLIPAMFRSRIWAWSWGSLVFHAAAAAGVAALAQVHGLEGAQAFAAGALFATLPMCRTSVRLPVLVDMPALAFIAWIAVAVTSGHLATAAVLVFIGAAVKETVPIFAAALALHPGLLVGLAVPAFRRLLVKPAPHVSPETATPFRYARIRQADRLLNPFQVLLPWGVCLVGLLNAGPWVFVSLALSYATLFVASDHVRLYQWGGIPLSIAAAGVIPVELLPFALAVHLLNPWQGDV